MRDLRGKTAVVTGASSGLGAIMARRLASQGANLVITARRVERLEALAAEIGKDVRVRVVPEDLADPAGPERLHRAATADGPVDILINNAGVGAFERFVEGDWERHRALLQLDVVSVCELAWRFGREMAGRGERAYVLNVASTSGIAPVIGFATYGGSKAFVLNFSQALAAELAGTGVTVTAVAPGPVATEFMDTAGMEISGLRKLGLMRAERCADLSLRAMFRGRRLVAPGLVPKIMLYGSRLTPNRLNGAIGGALLGAPRSRAGAIGKLEDGR